MAADQPPGTRPDEYLARARRLLQAGGGVGRVADDDGVTADHHLAGVDARAGGEPEPPAGLELEVQLGQRVGHGDRRPHGPEGVVLPQFPGAEAGHHCVADELLDLAPMVGEDGPHRVVEAGHHAADGFGVEALLECRRADHVAEDERHGAAGLLVDGGARARRLAPRGARGGRRATAVAEARRSPELVAARPAQHEQRSAAPLAEVR